MNEMEACGKSISVKIAKAQSPGALSWNRTQDSATYETSCLSYHAWAPDVSGQLYCVERNAIPLDQASPGEV